MTLSLNEDRVYFFYVLTNIGNDTSLGYLPVAVLPLTAQLVNSYADTVEIEVRQLSVSLVAQIDAPVNTKGEEVHQLSIVCVVNPISIGFVTNNSINNFALKRAAELPHVCRIYMAVQDSWYIVAAVYSNKLPAERITVAVLEENLFADVWSLGAEIHSHIFSVEGQAT